MNTICIILYFVIFPSHYTIGAIILIVLHRTAGPFMFPRQVNRDYSRLFSSYIAYSANNTGKHCVLVINIHTSKCNTLILGLLRFGLLHRYNIQDNAEWLFYIVLLTGFCDIVQNLLNTVITVTYFVRG